MKRTSWLTVAFVILFGATLASAGIINGDFEDGLNGWSIESGEFSAFADYTGNHWALSHYGGRLRQTFQMPLGAAELSFRYVFSQSGEGGGGPLVDYINFFLCDSATSERLIPPAEGFEGLPLFLGQDHVEIYAVNPEYVTVSVPDENDTRYVTLSLAHVPPLQDAYLEFGFMEYDDGRSTLLAVDDVVITIPEPGGVVLLCTGLSVLAGGRRVFPQAR